MTKAERRLAELDDFAPAIGWPTCEDCGHAAALNPDCKKCAERCEVLAEVVAKAGISSEEATRVLMVVANAGVRFEDVSPPVMTSGVDSSGGN